MYDEDVDFCMRARQRGRKIIYHPGVELIHIGEASSEPRSRQDRMWVARHRFYGDHHGRGVAAVYKLMILVAKALRRMADWRRR
jgi:GT2 family glycosyltransferase